MIACFSLALGINTFSTISSNNMAYVDKTVIAWNPCFVGTKSPLSRVPSRFILGDYVVRLSASQIDTIEAVVAKYSGAILAFVCSGHALMTLSGGDVDLLIETERALPRLKQAQMKSVLESELGLPVDILVTLAHSSGSAFETMVRLQAVPLSECT